MAACSIRGGLSVRVLNIDIYETRCAGLETQNGTKFCRLKTYCGLRGIQIRQDPVHFAGSTTKSWRFSKPLIVACESSSRIENLSKDCSEEKKSGRPAVEFMPNSSEVQSLLTNICDTASIAEFKLDFGGFRLYVKRGLEEKSIPPPLLLPSPTPSHTDTSNLNSVLNGFPATTSLAISKANPSTGIQKFLDVASDEGLVILQSPKVGFFRRSRTIKGKRAPPSCQEKQEVKEGQVLCYIEQLGGEIPIESDVSGEVIKIMRDDGEPVGYGDALIAILPSFPGIKKL